MLQKMLHVGIALTFVFVNCADCILRNRNNVCNTFEDYLYRDISPRCWYNPDEMASVPQMIIKRNYSFEEYKVATKDGYILSVFRIRKDGNKGVVYLQHPLTAASNVWVDKDTSSLGFILSNAGYDVWMGNFRGTIYSPTHLYLAPSSNAYWNHSFHEMAMYDLPAQINLVRQRTQWKDKITYIGHSMGTTVAFIYNALLPKHAEENVKIFIQLAPTGIFTNTKTPFKNFAFLSDKIMNIFENLNSMDPIPHNGMVHNMIKGFCYYKDNVNTCMKIAVYAGFGPDCQNINPAWFPIAISQNFAGFSIKTAIHYFQQIGAKRFQQYDYGKTKNMFYYGAEIPPLYPIENIKVPHYLIYGGNDWISVPEDVETFYDLLPDEAKIYGKFLIKPYNHYDTLYGRNVKEVVYDYIVYLLQYVVR